MATVLLDALGKKDWQLAKQHLAPHIASVPVPEGDWRRRSGLEGCYPLHLALLRRAPSALVLEILHAFPEAAEKRRPNSTNMFPLGMAFACKAEEPVILAILQANPAAASEDSPLVKAISRKMSVSVIEELLLAYPDVANTQRGVIMLHEVVRHRCDSRIILAVASANPDVLNLECPLPLNGPLPPPMNSSAWGCNESLRSGPRGPLECPLQEAEFRQVKLEPNALAVVVSYGYSIDVIRNLQALSPAGSHCPKEDIYVAACLALKSREFIMEFLETDACANSILYRVKKNIRFSRFWLAMNMLNDSNSNNDMSVLYMPFLEALHSIGGRLHLGPDSLMLLVNEMKNDLKHISWLVQAGVTTQYGFAEAQEGPLHPKERAMLRAWHQGEAIYKVFLKRIFSKVLPPAAATTISEMFGGLCCVETCPCHAFAARICL